MKIRNLCWLVAALGIAGCTATGPSLNSRMGSVSLGMSKQEVGQILGEPTDAATGRVYDGVTTTYAGFSEVHRYVECRKGATNDCIVVFNKDKVTEYGPYVGELRTRYNVFNR